MQKRTQTGKTVYGIVNLCVIALTAALFFLRYLQEGLMANNPDTFMSQLCMLFVVAVFVYGMKALRLYFLFLGQGVSISLFLKQYCKTIPVSIILPFKLGEFFRIYCFGYQISNYLTAFTIIFIDRFIDTVALVLLVCGLTWALGGSVTGIVYFLLFFLACVAVLYLMFPEVYRYWKQYFIQKPASHKSIRMLEVMERCNQAYQGISRIAKGKYAIVFVLSLIAWVLEIGGVFLLNAMNGGAGKATVVLDYLSSALNGQNNPYLNQYIVISVVVMLGIYVVLHFAMKLKGRKNP